MNAAPPLRPPELGLATGFRAAIEAASAFVGATAPNPPVGCAILDRDGGILIAAAHERAGSAHAEALALRRLGEAGLGDRAATMLVTLEPCNHTGRTPPCTEAILASGIRTVWIGAGDPNPHVAGHGMERLRQAGIAVHALAGSDADADGALARACRALIAPFRQAVLQGRPWITVKQALNRDGSMVPPAGATTFTTAGSLLLAHRLRRATDAVVTGAGTIRADDPAFTVRRLDDHAGRRSRLLAIVGRAERLPPGYVAAATARGFDVRLVDSPDRLVPVLAEAGILWAMVEAGPRLLDALRLAGLWDDWLTIARPPAGDGPDRLSVHLSSPAGDVSPLSLLPELSGMPFTKLERPCRIPS